MEITYKTKGSFLDLINNYQNILEYYGEPDEKYKYEAINTFQEHWNLDAPNFYEMFSNAFSKRSNLLYQNSWGFIDKVAELFPIEVKEMFAELFDENEDISNRFYVFQSKSEKLLDALKTKLDRENINHQQDERTLAFYLAMRYPSEYCLYKADYYKKTVEFLGLNSKSANQRYFHFLELVNDFKNEIQSHPIKQIYRNFYPKPAYDDDLLLIQNILYVGFKVEYSPIEFMNTLNTFDLEQVNLFLEVMDALISENNLVKDDTRLHFNYEANKLKFTIGQRDVLSISSKRKETFGILLTTKLTDNGWEFSGEPKAYFNYFDDKEWLTEEKKNEALEAMQKELKRSSISGYLKHLKPIFRDFVFDTHLRNQLLNQCFDLNQPISMKAINQKFPLNQILYGPPGTGKTYKTKKLAVEIIENKSYSDSPEDRLIINQNYQDYVKQGQVMFTTFHQSMSYEDFIEGIKPDLEADSENRELTYKIEEGLFKKCSRSALFEYYKNKQNLSTENIETFDSRWQNLISNIQEYLDQSKVFKLNTLREKSMEVLNISDFGNIIVKPEGGESEREYTVSYERTKKLFEAFSDLSVVRNIDKEFRAVIGGSNSSAYWAVLNYLKEIKVETKDEEISVAKKDILFNSKVVKDEGAVPNHVLIIDEINRGNVSSIFGELITLIEPDKRLGAKEEITVTLPYSKKPFGVPQNLYIIGTMNTADRSVEALDTALRRRFSFTEMLPNPELLSKIEYKDVDLVEILKTINQRIELLIDKDHQIGHSYFFNIKSLDDLKNTFKDKIIPLLEEYFYGDFGKIGLVLGENFVDLKNNSSSSAQLAKFGAYDDAGYFQEKKIFQLKNIAEMQARDFVSIYDASVNE